MYYIVEQRVKESYTYKLQQLHNIYHSIKSRDIADDEQSIILQGVKILEENFLGCDADDSEKSDRKNKCKILLCHES